VGGQWCKICATGVESVAGRHAGSGNPPRQERRQVVGKRGGERAAGGVWQCAPQASGPPQ